MTQHGAPLSENERADLVAYLDGELHGEAARAVEARISLDAQARAEADSLKRTWELLDFLPRPEPSPSFTERTLSRVLPTPDRTPPVTSRFGRRWRRAALAAGWAAAVLLAGLAGFHGYQTLRPREPGELELIRDLRLIENKRFYDLVDDFEFLTELDHPDLFGEDTGG